MYNQTFLGLTFLFVLGASAASALVILWLIPGLALAQATPGSSDACTPASFSTGDLPDMDIGVTDTANDTVDFSGACSGSIDASYPDGNDVVYGFFVSGSPTGDCNIACHGGPCAYAVTTTCDDTLGSCVTGSFSDSTLAFSFSSLDSETQYYLWVDGDPLRSTLVSVDVLCTPTVPVQLREFEID